MSIDDQTRGAYAQLFGSPVGRIVLADLIAYCHGRKSEFDPNDRVHAFNSGRRDVLCRITEFTNLTLEEIYRLRGLGRPIAQTQEDTDG